MSTIKEKLSNKPITTNIDGYMQIQIKNGTTGLYEDFRIHTDALFNAITTQLANIPSKVIYPNQSVNFTHSLDAGESIERIDVKLISGAGSFKVGTTPESSDVISSRTLVSGENKTIPVPKSYQTATTLYITLTGTPIITFNFWGLQNLI